MKKEKINKIIESKKKIKNFKKPKISNSININSKFILQTGCAKVEGAYCETYGVSNT